MAGQLLRVRLRPDQVADYKEWVKQREAHRAEFRECLASIGVTYEMLALDVIDGETWLLFYTESPDIKAAAAALQASDHPFLVDFKARIGLAWESNSLKMCEVLFTSSPHEDP